MSRLLSGCSSLNTEQEVKKDDLEPLSLREQIQTVITHYLDVSLKGGTDHKSACTLINFVSQCVKQRPGSLINGNFDTDCMFLQWLVYSLCSVTISQCSIIQEVVKCHTELLQLSFMKDHKVFQFLIKEVLQLLSDLVAIEFTMLTNVQCPPVHIIPEKKASSIQHIQAQPLHFSNNIELNTVLLSLLEIINILFSKIGDFPFASSFTCIISLCKHQNYDIRRLALIVSLKLVEHSVPLSCHITDQLCWSIIHVLMQSSIEESDVLVNCLYTVFGGNNKDAFAPVRFFDPLAKTLMDIIFAGRYHLSSKKFQDCIGCLMYQCWLVGAVSMYNLKLCLQKIVGRSQNLKAFLKIVTKALCHDMNELLKRERGCDSIEDVKKKPEQVITKKQLAHNESIKNSLTFSIIHFIASSVNKLSLSSDSKELLLHLEALSFLFEVLSQSYATTPSANFIHKLFQKYIPYDVLDKLKTVIEKYCILVSSDLLQQVMGYVIDTVTCFTFLTLKFEEDLSSLKINAEWFLTLPWIESVDYCKQSSDNKSVIIQWFQNNHELTWNLKIRALTGLTFICSDSDLLLQLFESALVSPVALLNIGAINLFPLVLVTIGNVAANSFMDKLLDNSFAIKWTESMLLKLSNHILLLCFTLVGVNISSSLQWMISQDTFCASSVTYTHLIKTNTLNIDEVSSKYCRILNFIVTTGYKWRDPLITILETSISHRAFINQDALYPLLSLIDHDDIQVVSILGEHSGLLFDLWGVYNDDIAHHPLFRKLTLLASSPLTKWRKVAIDILGYLGKIKKKGVFQQCVVLLLEMVLRGQVDIKAAAHCQIRKLSKFQDVMFGKLPLPLKQKVCKLLVEVLNEQPSKVLPENNKDNFCQEVSTAFGFKTIDDFLYDIIDPLVSLLVANGSCHILPFITFVSSKFDKTNGEFILANFHHIFSHLICHCSETRRNSSLQFIKSLIGDLDPVINSRRNKILNQLLLQISSCYTQVIAGISILATYQTSYCDKTFSTSDDVAEFLHPNFLSILKFFDAKIEIACDHCDFELGSLAISSLTSLIQLMGSKCISTYIVNVMALLRLSQKFTDFGICKKACQAWDCFVRIVPINLLGPLLSEIVVALSPWASRFPDIIASIFGFLIIANKEHMSPFFLEVYFIPDEPCLKEIKEELEKHVNLSRESVLEYRLNHCLKGLNHRRSDVKLHATEAILLLIKQHQFQVQEMIINNDLVNPVIAELVSVIICNVKEANDALRLKYGECLGLLGAIDPGRLVPSVRSSVKHTVYFEDDEVSIEFALELIEQLKNVFLAARDAQDQNCCAFAIQEVLSVLKCADQDLTSSGATIWNKLPENTQEIISCYLHSKYSPRYPKLGNISVPMFKISASMKYSTWMQKWTSVLITKLESCVAKKLFLPCTLIFKHNIQPAEFLLPHVLLTILRQRKNEFISCIREEIKHILNCCSNLADMPKNIAETVSLCTQAVFSSLDHLQKWVYHKKASLSSKGKSVKTSKVVIDDCNFVQDFLDNISKKSLAEAAFHCRAFARALKYLQQYLNTCPPDVVQENLKFLQEVYYSLNDVDGVTGVAAIRSVEPSIQEQILQYQSIGNFRDALVYYQKAIQKQPKIKYYEDRFRCMMNLGEFDLALTSINGLAAENPELVHIFNQYRIEAAWKLGNWDCLEHTLKENICCSSSWGTGLGKLLLAAKKKDALLFKKQIHAVRSGIMGPLTSDTLELGSYQKGYEHIVRLHMLQEVEEFVTLHVFGFDTQLKSTLSRWKSRLQTIEESFKVQEPVLNLRRTMLSLVLDKEDKHLVNNETGYLWLKSATVARQCNCSQAAHNFLVNARDYSLPEYTLENAAWISSHGDPHEALQSLQKAIGKWSATGGSTIPLDTKAKGLLMIGKLIEETDHDSKTILKHYKDVISIDPMNEEGNFCLGLYYDRLLTLVDSQSNYADVLYFTIKHYGDAMASGNRFIYHCLPRALSLWLDFGNQSGKTATKQEQAALKPQLKKITNLFAVLSDELAPYQFLVTFSQLISRVCHNDVDVFSTLEKIILHLIEHYPQQSLWLMIAVCKSSNSTRKSRCKAIVNKAKQLFPQWRKLIDDIIRLSGYLKEVCSYELPKDDRRSCLKLNDICRELVRMTKSTEKSAIMIPLQSSLTVTLPANKDSSLNHNPFPAMLPSIEAFEDRVDILASMQRPKKIVILGSDGKRYGIMCKPKDDMRKDCRLMEFNSVINKFLLRDPDCRQRHLYIRTYAVIPLSEDAGLVEWVENTAGYRPILQKIYQERGIYISTNEIKNMLPDGEKNVKKLRDIFVNQILPRHPTVFGEWFMKAFPCPTSWHSSNQAYARTLAVMSIVGYIVGLGDRHGENILIDRTNGDVLHVDFNCLFNKGETLTVPEVVPFRLTHNMVNAMGITKCQGTFCVSCEVTMKVLRQQKDPLMCVLKTLIHDPLVEWGGKIGKFHTLNEKALKVVSDIEERLNGRTGKKTLPLSVKSHVSALIEEATDLDKLCQMYVGWGPYL